MTNSLNIPYVQHFNQGLAPELEVLGGKGASLVTMTDAGMPVPPGFVVTTASYDEFLHGTGLAEMIEGLLSNLDVDDIKEVDRQCQKMRALPYTMPTAS